MPKYTVGLWGCTRKVNAVTTPKLQPPPLIPKNRSEFSDSLAPRMSPLAVTTVTLTGTCKSVQISRLIEVKTYLDDVIDGKAVSRGEPP